MVEWLFLTNNRRLTQTHSMRVGAVLIFGFIISFFYALPVSASTTLSSSHGAHQAIGCQTACQTVSQKPEEKMTLEDDDLDAAKNAPLPIKEIKLVHSGIGLLCESSFWRRSNWAPPDILVQCSAYSTSL